jgi:hypothetical protein
MLRRTSDIFLLSRYSEVEFHGIMPDTGAARISTGGQPQFRALQRELPSLSLDETQAGRAKIRFGPGQEISSLGRVAQARQHLVDLPARRHLEDLSLDAFLSALSLI